MKYILLLFFLPFASLAAKEYQLKVNVRSSLDQSVIAGALVQLSLDEKVIMDARTDAQGQVTFSGLKGKEYDLTVTKAEGYKDFYRLVYNKERKNIEIELPLRPTPEYFTKQSDAIAQKYFLEIGNGIPIDTSAWRTSSGAEMPLDDRCADLEQEASFPGGVAAMSEFIINCLQYPQDALELGEQGKVFVRFVVEPDGSISKIAIMKGVSVSIDKEALRLFQSMPRWIPAICNGKRIPITMILPLNFSLM